jgi:hypothetical protein
VADEKLNDVGLSTKPPTAPRAARQSKAADSPQVTKTLKKKQAFMYLGPNIPGGILFTGGVFKELPVYLKDVFEKAPDVKKLFVEIKEVSTFKAELERQGSEPYRLRQSVARLIDEGVLNSGRV